MARIVTCVSCRQVRTHHARRLCRHCYGHHQWTRTLDHYPPVGHAAKDRNPWRPTTRKALALVEDYTFLVDQGVTDRAMLAARLGITVRHLDRVASAYRNMIKENA